MPIVFIAAIDALARIRAERRGRGGLARWPPPWSGTAPAMMLAIAAALAFQFPLSSLWSPQTYSIDRHVAAARAAMARVPDGAQVATDLDLLAPLAARTDTFWLGNSATNPATRYVVFDTASTDWQPPPRNVLAFVREPEPRDALPPDLRQRRRVRLHRAGGRAGLPQASLHHPRAGGRPGAGAAAAGRKEAAWRESCRRSPRQAAVTRAAEPPRRAGRPDPGLLPAGRGGR